MNQLTIEQAQMEVNFLVEKIAANYQQLDSSEFGVVSTPGKFLCLSQTEPTNACKTSWAVIFQVLNSTFLDQNIVADSLRV